jgi:hypothetical protein
MYQRELNAVLDRRLREPRRFIQVVWGPRQVGKTTSVRQVLETLSTPHHYASADAPTLASSVWLASQWEQTRTIAARESGTAILALDEIQKIPDWSEQVKREWDRDTVSGADVRVVLLGSSPLLVQAGMTESLAGRFELLRWTHWTLAEMSAAFGWDVDTFIFHGGYPGAAPLAAEPERWRAYVTDSLIETSISRDVLLLTRVDKPALLRQLFHLACEYSGQIVAYDKLLGQLMGAGNTTTLAHYLQLLEGAGLVAGLQKYSGSAIRRRGSSPKLQVMNTGLMGALSAQPFEQTRADPARWGRFVESAVGAYLMATAPAHGFTVRYWRKGQLEVDFVLEREDTTLAIEVKGGGDAGPLAGLTAFEAQYAPTRALVVGADGIPVESLLRGEVDVFRSA